MLFLQPHLSATLAFYIGALFSPRTGRYSGGAGAEVGSGVHQSEEWGRRTEGVLFVGASVSNLSTVRGVCMCVCVCGWGVYQHWSM